MVYEFDGNTKKNDDEKNQLLSRFDLEAQKAREMEENLARLTEQLHDEVSNLQDALEEVRDATGSLQEQFEEAKEQDEQTRQEVGTHAEMLEQHQRRLDEAKTAFELHLEAYADFRKQQDELFRQNETEKARTADRLRRLEHLILLEEQAIVESESVMLRQRLMEEDTQPLRRMGGPMLTANDSPSASHGLEDILPRAGGSQYKSQVEKLEHELKREVQSVRDSMPSASFIQSRVDAVQNEVKQKVQQMEGSIPQFESKVDRMQHELRLDIETNANKVNSLHTKAAAQEETLNDVSKKMIIIHSTQLPSIETRLDAIVSQLNAVTAKVNKMESLQDRALKRQRSLWKKRNSGAAHPENDPEYRCLFQ
eukprot:GILK01001357.1.p1 GENE.GILK01001357.1~~GILK01001357.1.p1  ORF type:complete len:367 (+),score=92.35 GILK01001357.1:542-1642(+)